MRLQPIIEQAIIHNQWNTAIDLLENAVLQGTRLNEELLTPIPTALLMESPFLLKAKSENLCDQGKLAEAKELLHLATKQFASLGLNDQLLSALSMLAVVNVRMGLNHDAEPIVKFLYHEWRFASASSDNNGLQHSCLEKAGGDVAYAIARGLFLLDFDTTQHGSFYRLSAQAYDRENRAERGSLVLLEMIVQEQRSLTASEWEERLAEFSLRVKRKQASALLLDYLQALRWYAEGKLEQARQAIRGCTGCPPPYDVMLALLRCRIAIESGDQQASAVHIELLEQYDLDTISDMDWLYETVSLKFHYALLSGNRQAARTLLSQARGLLFHGLAQRYYVALREMNEKLKDMKEPVKPRVKLFGTLVFLKDNVELQQLQWKRKKTKELLIFLLLQKDYAAAKEQIAEALFSDFEPKKMANQLYVAAHQLKSVIKDYFGIDHAVLIKDGIVKLRDDWFEEVDVEKYQTLVRVGNQLWLDDRELAVRLYEQAIELYGDVAADFPYTDWLLHYREQLSRTQVELLRKLSKMALEHKRYEQAELYYRLWIDWLPIDEEANQGQLKLLMLQGKKAEAEALLRRFEEKLYDELGIAPMNETRAILEG